MSARGYDVIVVGARCAGAPTAMLLARKGYRVLAVDRATFPSDTVSTHLIHPPGVDALRRWGLLDRVVASGCPAIHTYAFDFGPFTLTGSPGAECSDVAYAPRRTVLDKTELSGEFEIKLQWTPEVGHAGGLAGPPSPDAAPPTDNSGPTIFTAVQEQLGLRLESTKGPVEMIVIDKVEKPSEN